METKIYTRAGDKGETSLLSGTVLKKNNLRLELYGTVDELNSSLGFIVAYLTEKEELIQEKEFLLRTQATLFALGSLLACESQKIADYDLMKLAASHVEEIEKRIDKIETTVGPLTHFILPGGSVPACHTHLARTVCRRLERHMVGFIEKQLDVLPEFALEYINRLSDYLFTLARLINQTEGKDEISWP